ncbi:HIT domain-containing protein [Gracilibacillus caseinilyticus]|uniref:HIT domain-containing protein n=1 Tax=Gracilibacillus caseinilyticus TaxID=2932256 RepID=A0ABY4ER79_9BACI|nr:HIT domain-containing protein [Gracilibacillus caseinilyticus]UOQ46845.1 HIT domain-containing protein [Gracilibacillus caseinilyticus]
MSNKSKDFYCDEVLSGNTQVEKVLETTNVLAFYHTHPFYEKHIVVIPKKHIVSLISVRRDDVNVMEEIFDVIKEVATRMNEKFGACTVSTNIGDYQSNKHMHWHVHFGKRIRD